MSPDQTSISGHKSQREIINRFRIDDLTANREA
jgi:hypothetical protein